MTIKAGTQTIPETAADTALDAALHKLREAAPEASEVEELAAATIEKRRNPHTLESVFTPPIHTVPNYLTCLLCGVTINNASAYVGPPIKDLNRHAARVHVDWHNALHQAGVQS